jgi:carbonic anhydrase/acetyltransferase-like protein (isoleucine patch superfamily)
MSNQIVISSGAKVRELEGVLTGTSGIVNALGINVPSGIPQLDGSGKILVSQLPNSVMEYKGSWNAATNTPTLVNGTGNAGDVYLCEVAGTVNFGAGPITFAVGDQVIYSGTIWQRASGATGTVTSVAVTESGDALTITGSPITTSGTINIGFAGNSGQYVNGAGGLTTFPSLTGFVPYTGATQSVNLGTYGLKAGLITTEGGYNFKILSSGTLFENGYSVLSSVAGNVSITQAISAGNLKTFTFDFSAWATNTSRTYTLPDLSGTLALLEGTQTFTGGKTFSALSNFDNVIRLKQNLPSYSTSSGYTTLFSTEGGGQYGFEFYNGGGALNSLNFPTASSNAYTFPAASGTIALTSNLSSYVPYTGATGAVNLGAFDLTVNGLTVGRGAGSVSTNTVLGTTALSSNTTGASNVAIGINSLNTNTTGGSNVAVGQSSLQTNNGNQNTAIGNQALQFNTTGSQNTALGHISLQNNTTGGNNIAIGVNALQNNTTASNNTAIGTSSLAANTTGSNTAIGHQSLLSNTTGTFNTAIGISSLLNNTTASYNTAIGYVTLSNNTTGSSNTAIGHNSLLTNTTGASNTAIGHQSLLSNTTASNNVAVGSNSLLNNTTGDSNTAIGTGSLIQNTTGVANTSIGYASLSVNTSGNYNVSLGGGNGNAITTGSSNILIGYNTGNGITTGSNNTIIGGGIFGLSATLSNNIILADGAGNIRYQWNGTNNVFGNPISGTSASFASSGGSDTFAINHSSGNGIALNITKGGNGEGLVINKTSGSGNALSVTGSTSLGALSGTSATFSGNVTLNAYGNQLKIGSNGGTDGFIGIGSGQSTMFIGDYAVGNKGLTLNLSTGAATFSSSVTAGTHYKLSGRTTSFGYQFPDWQIYNTTGGGLAFNNYSSDSLTITSGGNVCVNTTSANASGLLSINANVDLHQGIAIKSIGSQSGLYYIYFMNSSNGAAGRIEQTGSTSVNYTSGSDYRLKENIKPLNNSINTLLKLKPCKFTWKQDKSYGEGFIAHELQEIIPLAVVGKKDELDKDANPIYQGVDASRIVPYLVAAIQEQQAQIEELKAKIK